MHKISAILLVLAALSCKGKSQRSQSGFNDGGEVVDQRFSTRHLVRLPRSRTRQLTEL